MMIRLKNKKTGEIIDISSPNNYEFMYNKQKLNPKTGEYIFDKPFPPSTRIIKEGTIGDCPKCKSTTIKRFIWFGKSIGCIHPECDNYYKNK